MVDVKKIESSCPYKSKVKVRDRIWKTGKIHVFMGYLSKKD